MGGDYSDLCSCYWKDSFYQGYQRADLISTEELTLIKKVDRQSKARVDSVLLSEGRMYALLYLGLLKKLQRVDTMQSILVLIGDALLGDRPYFISIEPTNYSLKITMNAFLCSLVLHKATQTCHTFLYSSEYPLSPSHQVLNQIRALEAQDEFVQLKASQILTILLWYELGNVESNSSDLLHQCATWPHPFTAAAIIPQCPSLVDTKSIE